MAIIVAMFLGLASLYTAWLTLYSLIVMDFVGFIFYAFLTFGLWVASWVAVIWAE